MREIDPLAPRIKIAALPALFTLCNAVCGFASILVASHVRTSIVIDGIDETDKQITYIAIASILILAGMVFDTFDGAIARVTHTSSRFGAELDSLADILTFGVAPAFLLLKLGPLDSQTMLHKVYVLSATFFVVCAMLRLARFNIQHSTHRDPDHQYFIGLPTPAAAGCVTAMAILMYDIAIARFDWVENVGLVKIIHHLLPVAVFGLSFLMVSNIRYSHQVSQILRRKLIFGDFVQLIVLLIIIIVTREMSLLIVFWAFALWGPLRYVARQFVPIGGNLYNTLGYTPPHQDAPDPSKSEDD